MPSGTAIRFSHVSKRYGEVQALDDLTFEIPQGGSVGYLGPNGAGKTTSLKLLSGLARPAKGEVQVNGLDPARERRRALQGVGVLVETPGTLPYMRGSDWLGHIAEVKGLPSAERPRAVRRAAETLGVQDSLDRPLGTLSTGLLRRVLLAGALIGDPPVLLLDEPTLGLDPAARADLRVTLRKLAQAGRTLLLSTHLLEDVEEVCQRVLFLRAGRLVGDEPVHDAAGAGGSGPRTLRVVTSADVAEALVARAVGDGRQAEMRSPREFVVTLSGGPEAQSELLKRLITAGVPVAQAELVGSDLAARYMARVGREEAT